MGEYTVEPWRCEYCGRWSPYLSCKSCGASMPEKREKKRCRNDGHYNLGCDDDMLAASLRGWTTEDKVKVWR